MRGKALARDWKHKQEGNPRGKNVRKVGKHERGG